METTPTTDVDANDERSEAVILEEGGIQIMTEALVNDVHSFQHNASQAMQLHNAKRRRESTSGNAHSGEPDAKRDKVDVNCEMCSHQVAKYRCPRCEMRTCSLACVTRHKKERDCSGKREPFAGFTPINEMTDATLVSDLHFLEDGVRTAEVAKRHRPAANRYIVPKQIALLQEQCTARNIRLHTLSKGMTKRSQNTSYYVIEKQELLWHVEWRFPAVTITCTDDRLSENEPIGVALQRHFANKNASSSLHSASTSSTQNTEVASPKGLEQYAHHALSDLRIVMLKEKNPANKKVYYELHRDKTLKELLSDKDVIEFPTLLVLLPEEFGHYPLVYLGEEGEESTDLFNLGS